MITNTSKYSTLGFPLCPYTEVNYLLEGPGISWSIATAKKAQLKNWGFTPAKKELTALNMEGKLSFIQISFRANRISAKEAFVFVFF